MGCNCKAGSDIQALKSKYGPKVDNEKKKLNLNVSDIITKIVLFGLLIVSFPAMLIFIIFNGMIKKKTLTLKPILNERK